MEGIDLDHDTMEKAFAHCNLDFDLMATGSV